jgi:hypothetical protein
MRAAALPWEVAAAVEWVAAVAVAAVMAAAVDGDQHDAQPIFRRHHERR